ncbi:MAG: baseplate J/gp47 family protein [Deltaproteobacteria bacterium]|nr:baseplate J/gp47 family protein [Deltaproteobacteria bacterium]
MPIKPPNLDDRRYENIVSEARALIPQYCPEWTNLGDADPGMTLVQLFAWMTEMTIYRLNRVPDKTYIHFLNFIGEERRPARPSVAPVTFDLRAEGALVEIPAFTKVSTRQREDRPALDYLLSQGITVHSSTVSRVIAVRGGQRPAVREIPYTLLANNKNALSFSGGRGVSLFELDPEVAGSDAYTPHQFLYVGHDDFRLMNIDPESGRKLGRFRMRRGGPSTDNLSIVSFFRWEYPTAEGWKPVQTDVEAEEVLGMPEQNIVSALPGIVPLDRFGVGELSFLLPESVRSQQWWVRGQLDYERWLASRMKEDLEISWQDDRGGEKRAVNNWDVRNAGRNLEFLLQDLPPIRGGWTLRFAMVDRSLPAGRTQYLPRYRWYYRRGETWEEVPRERVRMIGTEVLLTGPLTDMATDGFNLRAERVETVHVRGFVPELELDLSWQKPVELDMFMGDDPRRVERMLNDESPWSPFQMASILPPTLGRKWWVGSDLFENRRQAPILLEIEIGFEMNGTPVPEPVNDYLLQLTYRAEDSWRVVHSPDKIYTGFTFGTVDPEGAKKAGRRRVRIVLDPKEQLKGLARHELSKIETTWLRFELIKANLMGQDDKKQPHPIIPRIYGIRLGVDKTLGDGTYDQPMPSPRMAQLDHREHNRRLTRCLTRAAGRLYESYPYFPFIDLDDDNLALYIQLDRPLPRGRRHAIHFRCRGEAFLPEGVRVDWELLEAKPGQRTGWRRLLSSGDPATAGVKVYDLTRTGELEFAFPEVPEIPPDGFWLRGRFGMPSGSKTDTLPTLPPVTHLMLNTVEAVNLHAVTNERFSGLGVPNQAVELLRPPIFLHPRENDKAVFPRPELFNDITLVVENAAGVKERWTLLREGNFLTSGKDDTSFVVDPVDGTLTFGNGIRGKMLPVGTNNVLVERYHTVPGLRGNVGVGEITVSEAASDLVRVTNLLPAVGGRDAETIEEIIRRAPSLLTSRDRAVTRQDFEIIAKEASGEVARAACPGNMGKDGTVEVVILPQRREGERVPDPFLSAGLRDHVQSYLGRRCLINVEPKVRLATFLPIDIAVTARLRPNANQLVVREAAQRWVMRFLDPYIGGLDGAGWPFQGTLYAQDFGRLVSDIPEVRHVVDVQIFDMRGERAKGPPGWEEGEGLKELVLDRHDLFEIRRVRIRTEEADE